MEKSNKKVFGFPKTSIGLCGAVLGTALIASVAVGTNASADEDLMHKQTILQMLQ